MRPQTGFSGTRRALCGCRRPAEYAEASARVAEEIRGSGATDFIHVGIGGSALGPMAVHKALSHPYYNALSGGDRRGPRMHFAENTDPATLSAILDLADPQGTYVNVVTKSGSTAETMANFLVIRGVLIDALGDFGFQGRTIATTDPEEGFLKQIADREDLKVLPIPADVGGRFSVLTPGRAAACGRGRTRHRRAAGRRVPVR